MEWKWKADILMMGVQDSEDVDPTLETLTPVFGSME